MMQHNHIGAWNEDIFQLKDFDVDENGDKVGSCSHCGDSGAMLVPDALGDFIAEWCTYCDTGRRMQKEAEEEIARDERERVAWVRIEAPLTFSGSKFVYKNAQTGELSMDLPPKLTEQWSRRATRDGLVYIHRYTGEVSEDPPPIQYGYDDNDSLRMDAAKQRMVNRINAIRAKLEKDQ